jgi:hypothetical protein
MPTTVVIVWLDPVATLKDLQDADVRKAASAIQTKQHIVYTHDVRGLPWLPALCLHTHANLS